MYNNYDYPEGSDTPDAPWNEEPIKPKQINVTVSVTLSKTVPVKVTDYTTVIDKKTGDIYIDYSDCDLKEAVKEQRYLPQEAGDVLKDSYVASLERVADEFSNWNVDDFEVILE